MNIVIPDKIELDEVSRKKLELLPNIKIYDDLTNDPKIIIERIKNADVVTANYIDLTKEIIEAAPNLKYIISPAVGYEWIDAKSVRARGVKVLNCPTFNTRAVAEHAIALMFAVNRKIVQANNAILSGEFNSTHYLGTEIYGKKLLCLGHGNIGSKIIEMAKGLGMQIDYIDSKTSAFDFDAKIAQTDVLIISVPLNEQTKGLINESKLSLLKSTAIIVNVARGSIIDQEPFYRFLSNGRLAGAGIDTFPDDQNIHATNEQIMKFAKLPNVVSTPHMAFNTKEAAQRLGNELIGNIKSCIDGNPINVVI